MGDLAPLFYLALLGLGVAASLVFIFRRRRRVVLEEDHYTRGLELWLAGEHQGAVAALRLAIETDPSAIDPYLQLGNLLRVTGNPMRAAVLHRTLTVRSDVPHQKRISIALALADDLIQLGQWEEARLVLDELEGLAPTSTRFWRARFEQWAGRGDEAAAARALYEGSRRVENAVRPRFLHDYELYQLDRALRACRANRAGDAKQLIRSVRSDGEAAPRLTFVRALIAGREGNVEQATELMTSGLVAYPEHMQLFLPALQEVLLEAGYFERTIPILETASQAEDAPPALWIALAMIYEKLGWREKGIELLERKAPDPGLTPDVAAPYLRLLAADEPGSDFGRVWHSLRMPGSATQWRCGECGTKQPEVLWFCPACRSFDTIALTVR